MLALSSPITDIRMINDGYAEKLHNLDIHTVRDFLYHIPFRYEDYRHVSTISSLRVDTPVTVIATITTCRAVYTKQGKPMQKATISDETGSMDCIWYNQTYLQNILTPKTHIAITGKASFFDRKVVFQSPEYEILKASSHMLHSARIIPIYPETRGISSKWIRGKIHTLLPLMTPLIHDPLSLSTVDRYSLIPLSDAIQHIHFPKTPEEAREAKRRIAFDELLERELASKIRRREWEKQNTGIPCDIDSHTKALTSFISTLPFSLTDAQIRSYREIHADMARPISMNRLLEGDVGSGKTVVAALSIYLAYLNGYSSALMAPTEILAQQHYASLTNIFKHLQLPLRLVTGSKKQTSEHSEIAIYIGTHALIEDTVSIHRLGLVVIDEQQRFGVEQRAKLRAKGKHPHLLSMTATPIPRTVALTIHADLDLSVLDQMPTGRKKIKTWVVPSYKRTAAYEWIRAQVTDGSGHQAFIICPLIEESESLSSIRSAKKEFDHLQKHVFPSLSLGLVHGRMKPKEKDAILASFRDHAFHILVATPVVEVGIDIPSATVILIEAADRFGLSQLHQLRGRVGRSSDQSYCLLFTETEQEKTIQKLKLLETHHLGPLLAEHDLRLRGSGDIFGTKQHGAFSLKYSDFSDTSLIHDTQQAAQSILQQDPELNTLPLLRERVLPYTIRDISRD